MFSWLLLIVLFALAMLDLMVMLLMAKGVGIYIIVFCQSASFLFGWWKVRKMDFNLIFYLDAELKKEQPIIKELWEEALVLIGACFLIIPGFLTDFIGIGFLLPQFRQFCFDLIDNNV